MRDGHRRGESRYPPCMGLASPPLRSARARTLPAVLTVLIALCAAAALAPQAQAAMPPVLPRWAPWAAAAAIAALLPLTLRRHWVRVEEDALAMRSDAGRERIPLRAVRRIELARYSGRYDVYVMLKGGGVRRVAAGDLADPDGVVAALGARGVPIVRL